MGNAYIVDPISLHGVLVCEYASEIFKVFKILPFLGEILKMNHYVKGVDSSGVLQYDVILSGYVPSLPENSNIHLYPYTEDYIQTAPGK